MKGDPTQPQTEADIAVMGTEEEALAALASLREQELVRRDLVAMEKRLQAETLMRDEALKAVEPDYGWRGQFSVRHRRLIANCQTYANNDPAGLQGHNLMLIVDKMATILDTPYPVDKVPDQSPRLGDAVRCPSANCAREFKISYKLKVGDECPECGRRYLVLWGSSDVPV